MLLSKQIAVSVNLAACRLKQYTAAMLRRQQVGLTPEQFLLLDLLWNEGPMSQQTMADTMGKDKNSITKLVNGLERKELLVRKRDKNDRRSNILMLTPKAKAMKTQTKEKGIAILDHIVDGISEEELTAFLQTLGKLTKNMEGEK